jgi:hypothetical protein
MKAVLFLAFLAFNFGWPFWWGYSGKNVLAPILWSIGMAIFAVGTGWRGPNGGVVKSVLIGAGFAMAVCVPIYFVGRWIA